MKINKLFLLGLAGLAFTACSSDEEMTPQSGLPAGTGAVSVKIVNPAVTRALAAVTPGTAGSTISVTGDLIVSLYESEDLTKPAQTLKIAAADVNNTTELKFWNVTSPGKITVSINDGKNSYENVAITEMQDLPAAIEAYGETTAFTKTNETSSPDLANDGKTEEGAVNGDENKVYQMYKASITMAIPVARLEVSGITHVTHAGAPDDVCEYSKLTIAGVYMDNLYTKGGAYAEGTSKYSAGTVPVDYCWEAGQSPSLGTGATAILKDAITDADRSFLADRVWPVAGQAYAYNFYAGADNPIFKIYFDESEGASSDEPRPAPRFAMVTRYVDDAGSPVTFENGKIYRITKAELSDKNIIGDEGGNTLYGVTVTVTEAEWSIVDIKAEWAK